MREDLTEIEKDELSNTIDNALYLGIATVIYQISKNKVVSFELTDVLDILEEVFSEDNEKDLIDKINKSIDERWQ